MSFLVVGALALAVALLELSAGPHFSVGDAQPHLVLLLGVIVTITGGARIGLPWAFVGGIALDVLAGRPLGTTAFALILPIAVAGLVSASVARIRLVAAIALVPICSA